MTFGVDQQVAQNSQDRSSLGQAARQSHSLVQLFRWWEVLEQHEVVTDLVQPHNKQLECCLVMPFFKIM